MGIGTTVPESKLHILSSQPSGGSPAFISRSQVANDSTTYYSEFKQRDMFAQGPLFHFKLSEYLENQTTDHPGLLVEGRGGSDFFCIKQNGRVGIGFNNPHKNLSVNEIIEIKKNTYTTDDGPYLHLSNKKGLQGGLQNDPTTKTGILGRENTTMGIKFITPVEYQGEDTEQDHVMAKIEYKLDRGIHVGADPGNGYPGRNTGKLSFWTSPDGAAVERMTIDKNGNVGINTSPKKLEFAANQIANAGGNREVGPVLLQVILHL